MFDSLSSKLQNAFRNLRGLGKISESNVGDALREVRMALLEADVNFKVARDFIERVRAKSLGAEVVASIQPGQQIIKFVSDELTGLLGSQNAGLKLDANPSCILMVGLHGSGKTSSRGCCKNRVASRCSSRRTFIARRRWINSKRSADKLKFRFF
jgi:signal recognition particle subunit SRP54